MFLSELPNTTNQADSLGCFQSIFNPQDLNTNITTKEIWQSHCCLTLQGFTLGFISLLFRVVRYHSYWYNNIFLSPVQLLKWGDVASNEFTLNRNLNLDPHINRLIKNLLKPSKNYPNCFTPRLLCPLLLPQPSSPLPPTQSQIAHHTNSCISSLASHKVDFKILLITYNIVLPLHTPPNFCILIPPRDNSDQLTKV